MSQYEFTHMALLIGVGGIATIAEYLAGDRRWIALVNGIAYIITSNCDVIYAPG